MRASNRRVLNAAARIDSQETRKVQLHCQPVSNAIPLTPLDLSLDELRDRFPSRTVMATMQCAGNRRADMQRVRPTSGDPWAPGAIGNAEWTGAPLAAVLRAAGADEDATLHVAFDCADECSIDGKTFHYGASIPITKALRPEVLLA